jgi:hypothetical protein
MDAGGDGFITARGDERLEHLSVFGGNLDRHTASVTQGGPS